MSRTHIVAELATAHGGSVDLAADMIRAAADAGADLAKLQTYDLARLNPADPQCAWLVQSHLDKAAHEQLIRVGQDCRIDVFSTPFDAGSLQMLRELGLTRFKIASSESGHDWFDPRIGEDWIVSWPWGVKPEAWTSTSLTRTHARSTVTKYLTATHLTAIPLYPTPLETVGRAPLLDGWSDHGEGLAACQWALAQGVSMLEVHLTIPGARCKPWDKSPAQIAELRRFADAVETMRSGVSRVYRERWSA